MSRHRNKTWNHKETGIEYAEASRVPAPYGTHEMIMLVPAEMLTLVSDEMSQLIVSRSSLNIHDDFTPSTSEENENETITQ